MKTIHSKIILLISVLTILSLAGLYLLQLSESRKINYILNSESAEKHKILENIISLMSEDLNDYVYDNSYWDEMVNFTATKNLNWAEINLEQVITTYDVNAVWILDSVYDNIYSYNNFGIEYLENFPVDKTDLNSAITANQFPHFFIFINDSLYEIRGAPIQPSDDYQRSSRPAGFLFAAKLWSNEYLNEIGSLTSSKIYIVKPDQKYKPGNSNTESTITLSIVLPGLDKKPVVRVISETESPLLKKYFESAEITLYAGLSFAFLMIGTVAIFLYKKVRKPLLLISNNLKHGSDKKLFEMTIQKNEFGELAKLIVDFFDQKKYLEKEIADRKVTEKKLRWNEALLTQVASSSPIAFYVTDELTDSVLYFNDMFLEMWGLEEYKKRLLKADITNSEILDVIKSKSGITLSNKIFEHNQKIAREELSLAKDKVIQRFYTTIEHNEGYYFGCLNIFQDITYFKEAEKGTRNALIKEKELNQMRSQFISTISHEYKTPLSAILASAELLERYNEKWSDDKKIEVLKKIQNFVHYMVEMLNDVLTINKIDSGKFKFNPVKTNLVRFCNELIEEAQINLKQGQEILTSFNEQAVEGLFDISLLRHIIMNLLQNAIKYSNINNPIKFNLLLTDQDIVLEIIDSGIGIPEEDKPHIYQPFTRGQNINAISGTGLGLSIVKHSVELHGGTINFESCPGGGTKFIVTIPFIKVDEHELCNLN